MKETKRVFLLILTIVTSLFLFSCKGKKIDEIKGGQEGEVTSSGLTDETKYEVEFFNNEFISGDSEMYEFYLLTKEGTPLSITITYSFEKDYYNKNFGSYMAKVENDVVQVNELVYDGSMYYFYDVTDSNRLVGSYKYLNYSKTENRNVNSSINVSVGYTIASSPDYTYETYTYAIFSSDIKWHEVLSEIITIVRFDYTSELAFTNNKITGLSYYDEGYKYYYSDYSILTTTVLLLNELSWKNDVNSLDSDYDFPTSSKKIKISMLRTLLSDKKGLMLKELGPEYLLSYTIDLDYGIISMGYGTLSTSSHNLYSKLTSEQLEKIKGIIKEELIKDFTIGEYSYKSKDESTDYSATIYRVRLLSNSKAEIVKDKYFENGYVFIPVEDVIVSGRYYILNGEFEKELVITDGDFTYRFRLAYNENKSIRFVSNDSKVYQKLFKGITDESIFYYGEKYIYGNLSYNQDKVIVSKFNSRGNIISNNMTRFIETHKSTYEDDTLWEVGASRLNRLFRIYKYEKSCQSFLEFDGEIYDMGPYGGGYGVTQLAYYQEGDKHILYYILSYGSGIHRSEVYSFDFQERVIKKVEWLEIPIMVDIEFGEETSSDDGFILSIYESELKFKSFPFEYDGEKKKLLIPNILDD